PVSRHAPSDGFRLCIDIPKRFRVSGEFSDSFILPVILITGETPVLPKTARNDIPWPSVTEVLLRAENIC
ncbi:MAG: hypothetical protein ACLQPD_06710, partial [Desulfomonilaceae bacterium]